jgi:hypothetical protein
VGSGVTASNSNGYVTVSVSASGEPAGANTEIQYNDGGAFGATSGFTIDATNARLFIGNATASVSRLHIETNDIGTDTQTLMNPSGILLRNSTPSVSYATRQYSPALIFEGQAWNGSANVPQRFAIFSRPANTGSGTTGDLAFAWSFGATAANTVMMSVSSNGRLFVSDAYGAIFGASNYLQATTSLTTSFGTGLLLNNNSNQGTNVSRDRAMPGIRILSYPWDSSAGAARTAEFRLDGLAIGGTSPTAQLFLSYLYNAGATSSLLTINSDGAVIVGGTVASSSALLQLDSTTRGLVLSRMTTAQRTGITGPTGGLLVFDNDIKKPYYHDGTDWFTISDGTSGTSGIAGTSGSSGSSDSIRRSR